MNLTPITSVLIIFLINGTKSVRLNKLFQYVDGYSSEHKLEGFLHVGMDYSIFLRKPKPHDLYLTYELYESKNVPDVDQYKPQLLAISQVPLAYIKDQLKTFRTELYNAMFVDDTVVPGTQVKTLREWQISRALNFKVNPGDKHNVPVLRTVL